MNKEIEVIHNFFCPNHFKKSPDEEFRQRISPKGEPVLTHISNFRPVKRILDVVHIFNKVIQEKDCRLLLVGDGPDRSQAEKLCKDLKISHLVTFLGKVKNPIEPLAISDVFILPSEAESFGLAALEAMAAGVPVISTNTGGLPEVNEQGESGFLRNVGDVDGMASDLLQILETPESLNEFKAGAKKRAQNFNIEIILPQYLDLYLKLIK